MEKKQYDLCTEVLRRLDSEKILEKTVLVGSWCVLFYADFFERDSYSPSIRTRDIDILIPIPVKFDRKVDVFGLIRDLGFVLDFRRPDGFMRFLHPELILEFIVPERGRVRDKPYDVPELGINAQPLRFMDLLAKDTIRVRFQDLPVTVPHPSNFALHKLIVSSRRKGEKRERDRNQAISILSVLIKTGKEDSVHSAFSKIPKKWQKKTIQVLVEMGEDEILAVLES